MQKRLLVIALTLAAWIGMSGLPGGAVLALQPAPSTQAILTLNGCTGLTTDFAWQNIPKVYQVEYLWWYSDGGGGFTWLETHGQTLSRPMKNGVSTDSLTQSTAVPGRTWRVLVVLYDNRGLTLQPVTTSNELVIPATCGA